MMKHDLRLSSEIYSKACIKKAIVDYELIAKIKATEIDGYWVLSFSKCKYDVEKTIAEFCNYLIDIHNSKE